ncbi:hypothetical protein ACIQ1D_19430 [Lysinibacillus xylanilyticus]|uniref:hypothetical protein n=1 Tax=Lysinibacillus xylanilyticus TaxID=582475 RepID=UPI00381A5A5D
MAVRKTTQKTQPVEVTEKVENEVVVEETVNPTPTARPKKRIDIDRDEVIPCRAGANNLVYISKRTSEKFEWAVYGDVQYITMGELISMKSTQPRMLKEGWLIVDDEEAIEQLGLAKMYGNLFEIDDIDEFFELSESEMKRILTNMPRGFKNSIATFARERIEQGELDSNRKIKLLEQLLDVDLKIFE